MQSPRGDSPAGLCRLGETSFLLGIEMACGVVGLRFGSDLTVNLGD